MTRKKKPQRAVCHVCGRRRLARFLEWHLGLEEWQCRYSAECVEYCTKQSSTTSGTRSKVWPPSDDWNM